MRKRKKEGRGTKLIKFINQYHMNCSIFFSIVFLFLFSIALVSCKPSTKSVNDRDNNQPQRERQDQRPSVEDLINEMGTNKDEKLSEFELRGPLVNDFSKIDKNNDGFLTKEELENAPKPERRANQGQRKQRGGN